MSLREEDLDLRAGVARVLGKGRKERLCPLGRPAIESLREYLAKKRSSGIGESVVFVNRFGNRLTDRSLRRLFGGFLRERGLGGKGTPTRCATRSPPICWMRGRPPLRPGAPRPREPLDHPDLHPRLDRAAPRGLHQRPPAREAPRIVGVRAIADVRDIVGIREIVGVPDGIRTRVTALKGRCPRPG